MQAPFWRKQALEITSKIILKLKEIGKDSKFGDKAIDFHFGIVFERYVTRHRGVVPRKSFLSKLNPFSHFESGTSRRETEAYWFVRDVLDPLLASRQHMSGIYLKEGDWINNHRLDSNDVILAEMLVRHEREVIKVVEGEKGDLYRVAVHERTRTRRRVATGEFFVLRRVSNLWAESFATRWSAAATHESKLSILSNEIDFEKMVLGLLGESNGTLSVAPKYKPLGGCLAKELRSSSKQVYTIADAYAMFLKKGSNICFEKLSDFEDIVLSAIDDMVKLFGKIRAPIIALPDELQLLRFEYKIPQELLREGSLILPTRSLVLPSTFYSFARWTIRQREEFRTTAVLTYVAINPLLAVFLPEIMPRPV